MAPSADELQKMLSELATAIRAELESLAGQYDARLAALPGYSRLPELTRRALARQTLGLIADALAKGDASELVEHVRERARQWVAGGLKIAWYQAALNVPEEILSPLIDSVPASAFLWRALNRSQSAIWQLMAERVQQAEQQLHEREQLLQLVVDCMPQRIFWKDRHSIYLGGNRNFAQAAGVGEPANLIGQSDDDLAWAKTEADAFRRDDQAVMESGQPQYHVSVAAALADGRPIWADTNKIPLLNAAGEVIGVLGTYEDITERKQAEVALRESAERFRRFSEITSEGLVFHEQGKITDANAALVAMFGYSDVSELLGKLLLEFIAPESRATVLQHLQSGSTQPYEALAVRKDGAVFPVEAAARIYEYQGHTVRVAAIHDVTERQQTELALSQLLAQHSAVLENALVGIAHLVNRQFVWMNSKMTEMFGYTPEEAAGISTAVLYPTPQDFEQLGRDAYPRLSQGETYSTERLMRRKDGRLFWCAIAGKSIPGGQVSGSIWILQDITERKRLEQHIQESLARRERQLQTSTEVAQEIAAAPSLEELFRRVVTLIKERFGYYHAQIFHYEPALDTLVLVAGYGEVGRQMLAASLGQPPALAHSVANLAAKTGRSILAADVTHNPDWQPNPYLPETQGELAVPIKLRDQVLGVLVALSDQAGALSDDDRLLLEGLCGQIAVALESARRLESVQQSERELAKFKLGLDRSSAAVFITDPQGVISYVNPAFEQIYGYPPEEAIGQTPRILKSGITPPEQYQRFWSTLLRGQTMAGELINKTKDGRLIPIEGSNNPILAGTGHVVGFLGIHTDITERKQAEETLARERNLLRTLIDNLPVSVFIKDRASRFLLNNTLHLHVLGAKSQAEALGLWDFDFFPQELAAQYYADEQALMQTGEPLFNREEIVLHQSTGQQQWSLSTKVPLRDTHGQVIGFLGFTQDITQAKLAEVEREQLLRDVQRRANQVEAVAEVGAASATLLETGPLLQSIVQLTRRRFNLYHCHIFLLDEAGQTLTVRACGWREADQSGPLGRQADGDPCERVIRIGADQSLVARAVLTRQPVIIHDVRAEPGWQPNPRLPDIQSEMALPMIVGNTVLGVFNVHSDERNRFTDEDARAMLTLATQAAIALQNARLFETANRAVQELDLLNRRLTGTAWETYISRKMRAPVIWARSDSVDAPAPLSALNEALTAGQVSVAPRTDQATTTITTPIVLRGQTVGALRVQAGTANWTADIQSVLTSLAGHIAQAAENARLLEESEIRFARERALTEATDKIRRSADVDRILEAAAAELAQYLQASAVAVRIGPRDK